MTAATRDAERRIEARIADAGVFTELAAYSFSG